MLMPMVTKFEKTDKQDESQIDRNKKKRNDLRDEIQESTIFVTCRYFLSVENRRRISSKDRQFWKG
jgi:hypothetical protein